MSDPDIDFRLAKREALVPYRRSNAPGGMEMVAEVATVFNRPLTQADTHFYRVASCSFTSSSDAPGGFIIYAAGNGLAYDQIGWCLQQFAPFREWVRGLLRRPAYPPHMLHGSPSQKPGAPVRVSPEHGVEEPTLSPTSRAEASAVVTAHTVVEKGALNVACIVLHAVHAFGSLREGVAPPMEGMVHAEAICTGVFPGQRFGEGYRVPGVTFVRNPVCFVLPIVQVRETGRLFAVVVGQYRLCDSSPGVPNVYTQEGIEPFDASVYGGNEFHDAHLTFEIPAGQIDTKGEFRAKAMDELREETGLVIPLEKSRCLNTGLPCHFSIGGCTEKGYGYYTMETLSADAMRKLASGGVRGVGSAEKTVVRFVPLHRLAEFTGDAKAHFALSRLAVVDPELMAQVRRQGGKEPTCAGKGGEGGLRGWLKWFGISWVAGGGVKDLEV